MAALVIEVAAELLPSVSIDAPHNFRIRGVNVVDRRPGRPAASVRWWTEEAAEAEKVSEQFHAGQPRHGMEDKGDDSRVSVEAPEWMRTYGAPVAVRTGDEKRPFVSAKWWKYEARARTPRLRVRACRVAGCARARARARALASPLASPLALTRARSVAGGGEGDAAVQHGRAAQVSQRARQVGQADARRHIA